MSTGHCNIVNSWLERTKTKGHVTGAGSLQQKKQGGGKTPDSSSVTSTSTGTVMLWSQSKH